MKRLNVLPTALAVAILAACGGPDVYVEAQLSQEDGEGEVTTRPLAGLEVRLIPYDRDEIFDSLEAAAETPEPPIPDSVLTLRDSISEAYDDWQTTEFAWGQARDSLQQLSERMNQLSPASDEYTRLFRQFNTLEQRVNALDSQNQEAFSRFTGLQDRFGSQSQAIRLERSEWADEAFEEVDSIIEARLEEMDLEELTDTTNAAGFVRFEPESGDWWATSRYDLQYSELYWNVPVDARGDSVHVQLTRENAVERPKF